MSSSTSRPPLSAVLPPLIFGTATFNTQYNDDPYSLDTVGLVAQAMTCGIRAFDTSPYYGPSELLLGNALASPVIRNAYPRESYYILTKVGRIASSTFDYTPAWVRHSVRRSLERLHTDYLDVVYCHDVEFVSPAEVLSAVQELRRLRDEGLVRYVGISGFPIDVLVSLAHLIRRETGEPLDIVMSYGHYTLQNSTLGSSRGIDELLAAGVDIVPNASMLGMGLLRRTGVPITSMGDWHPSPRELRAAVRKASDFCDAHGERLEVIAIRWALESWLSVGAKAGSRGDPASGVPYEPIESRQQLVGNGKLGVSVIGVSNTKELEKMMMVWRSVLDGLEDGRETAIRAGRWERDHEWSLNRRRAVEILKEGVTETLGSWADFAWPSPDPDFFNKRGNKMGTTEDGEDEAVHPAKPKAAAKAESKHIATQAEAPWPTPAASPEPPSPPPGRVVEQKSVSVIPMRERVA